MMEFEQRYHQTLSHLFLQFPQYQQTGAGAYKSGLGNMLALDNLLEQPHKRFQSIHIAGTNGKGSVSHMLAAILQQAGYKVGLYTSPHLTDFRERIRINGEMIPKEDVLGFIDRYQSALDEISPSFFEITTAMAFCYFARQRVDLAVIETGLGGRLDSTNIIHPVLSVITNIGLDHCEFLGNAPVLIAAEKAGIIKPHVPVVIGERDPQTDSVFINQAREVKAFICFAQDSYKIGEVIQDDRYQRLYLYEEGKIWSEEYLLDLLGAYQQKNLPTVLMAAELLRRMGKMLGRRPMTQQAIKNGLMNAAHTTGLRGRWERISQRPKIIVDTAHNAHGIKWVVEQLLKESFRKLHFIFGVVADKDLDLILPLLPIDAHYYCTQARIPRALNAHLLAQQCQNYGLDAEAIVDVKEAMATARERAFDDDLIFIGGSTYVVADALRE